MCKLAELSLVSEVDLRRDLFGRPESAQPNEFKRVPHQSRYWRIVASKLPSIPC